MPLAVTRRKRNSGVHGQRLPGLQAVFELLGKDLGVGGGLEGLLRNFAGDLVLAVAVGNSADKGGDDDLRPHLAYRQHCIVEHAVVSPAGEGFLLSFGEAEVRFGAPELFGAVVLVGLEQFVGADETERVVGVGGHGVLAALAAGEGEERDAHAESAREIGEQRSVLVVRVRHDVQHAGSGAQPLERLLERCLAAVFGQGKRDGAGLGGWKSAAQRLRGLLRAEPDRYCARQDEARQGRTTLLLDELSREGNIICRQCTIR